MHGPLKCSARVGGREEHQPVFFEQGGGAFVLCEGVMVLISFSGGREITGVYEDSTYAEMRSGCRNEIQLWPAHLRAGCAYGATQVLRLLAGRMSGTAL